MTRAEKFKFLLQRDKDQMVEIEALTSSGVPPDRAAVRAIKREGFQLSEFIKDSLSAPALTR